MLDFRDVLTDSALRDVGFLGSKYTWCNTREDTNRIGEGLDRFLANSQWCKCFPQAVVNHGVAAYSDHLPL